MKKLFAIVLSVLLVMSCFAGCGSSGAASADNKLTVATSPDFPPF